MHNDAIGVKGFTRLRLQNAKTGEIEGDSGWCQNVVTEIGFDNYIVDNLGGAGGALTVTHLALGTQTNAPVSTQTQSSGEAAWANREAATTSLVGNGTFQCTASWATDEATQSNVGSIAMHNTSTVTGASAACIATFASSTKTTDQTLSATYQLRFS